MLRNGKSSRVVVTGLGVATSLGLHVPELWDAIVNGRSGIDYIRQFDSRAFPVRIGGEIDLKALPEGVNDEPALRVNRILRFAKWAADQAWSDASLERSDVREQAGVCIGSGGFPALEAHFADAHNLSGLRPWSSGWLLKLLEERPELLSQYRLSAVSTLLSQRFQLAGPSLTIQGACTSGTQAIGEAFRMIRSGRARMMLCGGADSMLSAFCLAGFTLLGALSTHTQPKTASRPFDLTRNGFVIGEGAAIAVLESLESAQKRGARVYAEVIGYGSSSDGYRFTDVHPEGRGAISSMLRALADAAITPDEVGYINAHGTSTPQNDRIETSAIKTVFGDHAAKLAVSSTKSHLGHLICAAGAVELVLTALALQTGILPATINLHRRDPECDLDFIPVEARWQQAHVALSNSFGFGGQNGTIALRQWE
jgi:3-oxoacyl-[acyl-carrier-protein] synthase II